MIDRSAALVTILFIGALAQNAYAETEDDLDTPKADSNIETMTVVATRTQRVPDQIPASVTAISEEQITRQLSTSIADLVRYEPGVSVGGTGSRWGIDGFTIRGIGGNRVLVVHDGVRVPDEFSFGPFLSARRDVVDVDSLSRVEIVRGPVSTLHGSDAMGGVVAYTSKSVVSRMQDDKSWFLQGKVRTDGASDSNAIGIGLGFRTDAFAGGLFFDSETGSERKNAGKLDINGPQREAPDPQEVSVDNIVAKLSMSVNPLHTVHLTLDNFSHRIESKLLSDYDSSFFGTITHTRNGIDERDRTRLTLNYKGQLENTYIDSILINAYGQSTTTEQLTLELRESRGLRTNRTRQSMFEQDVQGFLVQVDKLFEIANVSHHLIVGWDHQTIDSEEIRYGSTFLLDGTPLREFFPYPTRDFPLSTTSHGAAYAQDEMTMLQGILMLSVGIRHHFYNVKATADDVFRTGNPGQPPTTDVSDSRTTAKIGAVFMLNEPLSFYGNIAQGFRAPPYSSVNVGFTNPIGGYKTISNPELQSESSNSLEMGIRYVNADVAIRLTAFRSNFKHFIEDLAIAPQFGATRGVDPRDGFLTFQSVNRGRVQTSGWEMSGDANLFVLHGIETRGKFAYGFAQGENRNTGQPINSIDPAKLVAGISGYGERWQASFVMTHVEEKRASEIADDTFSPLDGHTIVDIMGEFQVQPNITINAGIFNLMSEEYIRWADAPAIGNDAPLRFSQPGRHGLVSISVKL